MTQYYTVRDRIEDMLDHLEDHVSPFVWDVVERRVDEFIGHLNDVIERIIENPEWEEEGNREIRDYAELLELHVTSIDPDEVPDSQEDTITPEVLDLIRGSIKEYIIDSLPDAPVKSGRRQKKTLEELVKKVEDYMEYQNSQVRNVTRDTLMTILTKWYNDHRDIVEDIDSVYDDVSIFVGLVHDEIDTLLDQSDTHFKIESYISQYNDELFDLLTDRDPDTQPRYDVSELDDAHLSLMLGLRWISGPRDLPDSIMLDLLSLRDTRPELHNEFLSTGVELDDLISNYESIEVTDRMRKRLEVALAKKR